MLKIIRSKKTSCGYRIQEKQMGIILTIQDVKPAGISGITNGISGRQN
jgi:hypothetical protein